MASNNNTIQLRLPANEPPPEQVPYELRNYISSEAWQARLRAVIRKGSRYIRPRFDAAWGIITFIASFAAPIAAFYIALRFLPYTLVEVDDVEFVRDEADLWKARGISLAAFLAVVLLLWVPMFLWKRHGQSQVNQMLQRFEKEDRAVKPNAELPTYRIARPSIGGDALILNITVPTMPGPTSFQYGAQLPPYIVNAPSDPSAAMYGMGVPPPNVGQNVPLYNQYDEKVPDYSGPPPGMYIPSDEKYEDVRV